METPIIHALIPARGGSKTIPRKNVKMYHGKPLIAHSIEVALQCPRISRIVVSTDCEEIQKIAIKYKADAPYLRPSMISGDLSTDYECFSHYFAWLRYSKQSIPDVIVHLRPTYPERLASEINDCLDVFLKVRDKYDSLRTVVPMDKPPFKMYTIQNNMLMPLFETYNNIKEPFNQVRQILPECYWHNGYVDIMKRETIEKKLSISGSVIYPYVMHTKEDLDIDTDTDWKKSLQKKSCIPIPIQKRKVTGKPLSYSLPIDIPGRVYNLPSPPKLGEINITDVGSPPITFRNEFDLASDFRERHPQDRDGAQ